MVLKRTKIKIYFLAKIFKINFLFSLCLIILHIKVFFHKNLGINGLTNYNFHIMYTLECHAKQGCGVKKFFIRLPTPSPQNC